MTLLKPKYSFRYKNNYRCFNDECALLNALTCQFCITECIMINMSGFCRFSNILKEEATMLYKAEPLKRLLK